MCTVCAKVVDELFGDAAEMGAEVEAEAEADVEMAVEAEAEADWLEGMDGVDEGGADGADGADGEDGSGVDGVDEGGADAPPLVVALVQTLPDSQIDLRDEILEALRERLERRPTRG